ncbi:MAG TPA: 50S ribosomal protein L11 methyltransferase [bacterium]|nr:50S ribosomal protein L11 methyltransferase [bacterium]
MTVALGRPRARAVDRPKRAPPATGRTWVEITVDASVEASEAAIAILEELRAGGLVEESRPRARRRFRCYLPLSRLLPVTLRGLGARLRGLRAFGLDPGPVRVTHRPVSARRWATAWRRHVQPVRVGRVFVRPSWVRTPAPAGCVAIEIDPGMAFGTGLHPSTRLCLRALLTAVTSPRGDPARTVFDVGTGSGILAIAAARLGARRVWAVDSDPVAVAVARDNVRRNHVDRRVRVTRGDGLDGAPGVADVIAANIVADVIIPMLPAARRRLGPGGVCIGSGIVADRVRGVLRAARAAGFLHRRTLAEGEWRALVLEVAPARARRATA